MGGTGNILDALTTKAVKILDFSAPRIPLNASKFFSIEPNGNSMLNDLNWELDPVKPYFPSDLINVIFVYFATDDETGIPAGKLSAKGL